MKKEAEEIKDNMAHTAQSARYVTDKSIHARFSKTSFNLGISERLFSYSTLFGRQNMFSEVLSLFLQNMLTSS